MRDAKLITVIIVAMLFVALAVFLPALAAPPTPPATDAERIADLEAAVARLGVTEVVAINVQPGLGDDVKQGDAILTISPTGRTFLIDAGYEEHADQYIIPYLTERGLTHLNHVAFTHPNIDHMGGVLGLLKSATITIDEILTPNIDWDNNPHSPSERPVWDAIRALAATKGVAIATITTDQSYHLGAGAYMDVLHGWSAPVNFFQLSLVTKVRYGGGSVLLTGDAMSDLWVWLKANKDITADVVKLPHHCDSASNVQLYFDDIGNHAIIATAPHRIMWETKCTNIQQSAGRRSIDFYANGRDGHISAFLRWDGVTIETEK